MPSRVTFATHDAAATARHVASPLITVVTARPEAEVVVVAVEDDAVGRVALRVELRRARACPAVRSAAVMPSSSHSSCDA